MGCGENHRTPRPPPAPRPPTHCSHFSSPAPDIKTCLAVSLAPSVGRLPSTSRTTEPISVVFTSKTNVLSIRRHAKEIGPHRLTSRSRPCRRLDTTQERRPASRLRMHMPTSRRHVPTAQRLRLSRAQSAVPSESRRISK